MVRQLVTKLEAGLIFTVMGLHDFRSFLRETANGAGGKIQENTYIKHASKNVQQKCNMIYRR